MTSKFYNLKTKITFELYTKIKNNFSRLLNPKAKKWLHNHNLWIVHSGSAHGCPYRVVWVSPVTITCEPIQRMVHSLEGMRYINESELDMVLLEFNKVTSKSDLLESLKQT